jgi:hypothetical protein
MSALTPGREAYRIGIYRLVALKHNMDRAQITLNESY